MDWQPHLDINEEEEVGFIELAMNVVTKPETIRFIPGGHENFEVGNPPPGNGSRGKKKKPKP